MSQNTSIEWTDATWNPIRGTKGRHHCVRVSEGCKHCYAATMNHRFGGPDYVVGADTPRLDEEALLQPLKWTKPRRIFVCSMTDLFLDEHTDEMIDRVFAVMALCPQHTFQVLTKRAKRMRRSLAAFAPLPNVWLGVSAENQTRADERIPDLLATPAAVRFVSAEPLLGPVDIRDYLGCAHQKTEGGDIVCGKCHHVNVHPTGIDWVIVGGESGPGARPCDVYWVRSIKDQCVEADVPVFVKQLGARPCESVIYSVKDPKGGDPSEWPADLRVRQMPEVTR